MIDFKSVVEFNKYTVALAAASFVYTLEKFVPMPTAGTRLFVLAVLLTFLASAILGVVMFAASTGAQHGAQERKERIQKVIPWLGIAHSALLCIGLVALGGMLLDRVMAAPEPIAKSECCCTQERDG
jgi:amino acid transporter